MWPFLLTSSEGKILSPKKEIRMKKWMTAKGPIPPRRSAATLDTSVRAQLRKLYDGRETGGDEVSDAELWRPSHHKKTKQTSYEKVSYV
jgi:hypothetical protein